MKARLTALVLTALLAAAGSARAQQDALITPNYKDADLGQVIEAVSQVTGKNFIVDPRVKAQVTMLSSTPMNAAAFYEAFLAILQVHGFVAVPSGKVIKILPDANARQLPANDLPDRVSSTSDEIVTQVIQVRAVSAAQLVPILRPLIPQYGHLAAYPASNILIISDRASNVSRMVRIIQRIDQAGDSDVDVIRLEHASAAEIVRVVNALSQASGGAEGGGGGGARLVADERTNSVLLGGEATQRLRMKTLIAHLDTPLEAGGDTQVRYLRYADAEKIAAKLKEQLQGAAAGPAGQQSAQAQQERSTTIWADPQMNALIVTAPPKVMRSLMSVVDRLDVRRAQVLVEALLVELSIDKAADLGVNWLVDGSNDNFLVGLYNQAVNGVSIGDIAKAVAGVVTPSTSSSTTDTSGVANVTIPGGLTVVGGRKQDTGTNYAVMLRAQMGAGNTNVISMPSVITMDNEEAQIKVAQEVPFVTGQYTNTGAAAGSVNPFQTIQRQEVGIILKITPQITDDGTILLKIAQEASTLAPSSQGAVDLITNKRTINTRVLVDDGGMLVLGGLIQDNMGSSETRVTGLGSIPVLGALFRVRSTTKVKTNLMVFIRPRVLRDAEHAAFETNSKYNYLRDLQRGLNNGKVPLMYGEQQPQLPALEGPSAAIPGRAAQPPGANTGTPAAAPTTAPESPAPPPSGQQPVAAPPPTAPPADGK